MANAWSDMEQTHEPMQWLRSTSVRSPNFELSSNEIPMYFDFVCHSVAKLIPERECGLGS